VETRSRPLARAGACALLITRGIEASTGVVVFLNFPKHFIQSGSFGVCLEPVIAAAQQKNTESLNELEEETFAILDGVVELYWRWTTISVSPSKNKGLNKFSAKEFIKRSHCCGRSESEVCHGK
jgi:hypothetical protein